MKCIWQTGYTYEWGLSQRVGSTGMIDIFQGIAINLSAVLLDFSIGLGHQINNAIGLSSICPHAKITCRSMHLGPVWLDLIAKSYGTQQLKSYNLYLQFLSSCKDNIYQWILSINFEASFVALQQCWGLRGKWWIRTSILSLYKREM